MFKGAFDQPVIVHNHLAPRRKLAMKFFLIVLLLACLLQASAVSHPKLQNEEPLNLTAPEIAKLIDECGLQTTRMANRLFDYSFNETDTDRVLDKKLALKSEQSKVFEVYPIAIRRRVKFIYVQISENGVPLSAKKLHINVSRPPNKQLRWSRRLR
jgi:hypothetical protein